MYYKQPRYYGDFKCIGGTCSNSCCCGWRITWTSEEVDKLLNANNISAELHELVEKSFIKNEKVSNAFQIELKENKKCPFLTENMLCKIQKELDEEFLSHTCMSYPRKSISLGEVCYHSCHMSCPEVIKQLLFNEKSMDLITMPTESIEITNNYAGDKEKHPKPSYYEEIFEFFYELFSDKKIEIERAIMLGAIAADRLTQTIGREDYDSVSDEIKELRHELKSKETLDVINSVQPNPRAKLGFIPMIAEEIVINSATKLLHDAEGYVNMELYERGTKRLNDFTQKHRHFLRNIALNLLLDLNMPFKFLDKTIFENYGLFVSAFACIKLNILTSLAFDAPITMRTSGSDFKYEDKDSEIIGFITLLFRGLGHNNEKSELIIDLLKENNFCNHAYYAAFIL